MYYNNVLDLIGGTPLICLKETMGLNIFAKAEFLNPGDDNYRADEWKYRNWFGICRSPERI